MSNTKKLLRQRAALTRLEDQLKSGVKPKTLQISSKFKWDIQNELVKQGYSEDIPYTKLNDNSISIQTPLTDSDKNRIEKEIVILKSKIK